MLLNGEDRFAATRTAGWIERQIDESAAHFAYVRGPAKGIAFLPIRGIVSTELKSKALFKKWSHDEKGTAFIGAIVTTPGCKITLQNEAGEPVVFDMSDINTDAWADHGLGFTYQCGLWLVLRENKIAVFGGNGSNAGVNGKHLKGKPLGYLSADWEVEWAITSEVQPTAEMRDGVAILAAPIPQTDAKGVVKKSGKSALIKVQIPVQFE